MTNLLPIIAQAEIPVPEAVIQYGMAGAVIVVVILFLRFLEKEREDRKAERESFVKSIEASAAEHTIAAKEMSDSLRALCLRIEHCPSRRNGRGSTTQENGGN